MPDKLVSIRMNENLAEILEERANSLNKLAPEIKVTMGAVYAMQRKHMHWNLLVKK